MSDYIMIETAFNNKDEAHKVRDELLSKKLVASTHIIESESSWNWNNEREDDKEYIMQMKTKAVKKEEIYEVIKSIHSYETFEFAIYEISSINKDYLKWLDEEVK